MISHSGITDISRTSFDNFAPGNRFTSTRRAAESDSHNNEAWWPERRKPCSKPPMPANSPTKARLAAEVVTSRMLSNRTQDRRAGWYFRHDAVAMAARFQAWLSCAHENQRP